MKRSLLLTDVLNLRPEDLLKFRLLFFHSFFLGIFIAFYFIPSNALFIEHFGSEQLPYAYLLSGIVGYLSSIVYSYIQKHGKKRFLFAGALILLVIVSLSARIAAYYFPIQWVSFFVFVWTWPFISLTNIISGGLAIELLDLRQVKRLYGLINMGGIFASILAYFTIPLFVNKLSHYYDLFYFGIIAVIISLGILSYIFVRFPEKLSTKIRNIPFSFSDNIFSLLKEKYLRYIFFASIFSVLIIYFSDFAFLSSIKIQTEILQTPHAVSSFMAIVFGSLKLGELILSLSSSRLLSKYGIRFGLTVLPFSSLLLMFAAILSSYFWGAASIAFLAIMTINKASERILRRGLDDPSFNVLYQTLPKRERLSIQTKIGVVMQISIGLAGIILIAVNWLITYKQVTYLELFPLFISPFVVFWLWIVRKLYTEYKNQIQKILKKEHSLRKKRIIQSGTDIILQNLDRNEESVTLFATILIQETNPVLLQEYSHKLLQFSNPTIYQLAKNNIRNLKLRIKPDNKQLLEIAEWKESELLKLSGKNFEFKMQIINHISNYDLKNAEQIVFLFLSDSDCKIKQYTINLASKYSSERIIDKLIEYLEEFSYSHLVIESIAKIGTNAIPKLEKKIVSSTNVLIIHLIVEIYTRMQSVQSSNLLFRHISYPSKNVQTKIIKSLYKLKFIAVGQSILLAKEKIKERIGDILWLMVSIHDLEKKSNTLRLIQSLELEKENRFDELFYLLSFIYQPELIDLIKTNLKGENTIYALEIIDNFISPDIKKMVIPIFDKISVTQKMKKLSPFFEIKKLDLEDRLKDIILKEYSKIDLWSKVKAIELIGKLHKKNQKQQQEITQFEDLDKNDIWTNDKVERILEVVKKSELPDAIFACLHHPNELIYSTAAKIIYEENPAKCLNYLQQLLPHKQQIISQLQKQNLQDNLLLIDKLKLVKKLFLFFSVSENLLLKLVRIFRIQTIKSRQKIFFTNKDKQEDIIIVLSGEYFSHEQKKRKRYFKNNIIMRIKG